MLIFQNDGVLPIEGFTTFGMSAKPGSTNPIGKFGTGLKNSVAIILRLGGTFTLFRGTEEYVFYTKEVEFRGKSFSKVRMKRRKGLLSPWRYESLPFTTELGKHWKPWMAFRELEANTRDELNGKTEIVRDWENSGAPLSEIAADQARAGTTMIVVECEEIESAFERIDDIFLPDQKVLFESDQVRVYEGNSDHVFFRGMRVTDLRRPSLFTYEMKHVQLTEDRTSMYSFLDDRNMMKALLACDLPHVVNAIIAVEDEYHEATFDWDDKKPAVSDAWYGGLRSGNLSPRFETLRDNLQVGLGSEEDIEVILEVNEWEQVLDALDDGEVYDKVREQMEEEGWKAEHDPTF